MTVMPPFVEAPTIYTRITSSLSGGMDTSAFDAFRQGVELTRDPLYYMGIVKIHSGEPRHEVPQREFGMEKDEIAPDQTYFSEIDPFDPVLFVLQQQLTGAHPSITYPVVFEASILKRVNQGNIVDGAIEPLAIRYVAQIASIDAPFESHAMHGNLESGGFNKFIGADQMIQRYEFAAEHNGFHAYEDQADNSNGIPTGLGFFPNSTQLIAPFVDGQLTNGIEIGVVSKSPLALAMRDLNPATDNYAPGGYKIMPSGFSWQNTYGLGSESTAFGNQLYKKGRNYKEIDLADAEAAGRIDYFASLNGLQWLLPRVGNVSATVMTTLASTTVNAVMSGNPAVTYSVTLRFRGLIEQKTYTGGTNDGAYFQTGGTAAADAWNVYRLTTTNPVATYYINRGTSGQLRCYGIDYTATIPINGGSTVTLYATSTDGANQQITNNQDGAGGSPYSVPGITSPAQPYDGQFIQMDVVSVV